jgi:adenylate cyclase
MGDAAFRQRAATLDTALREAIRAGGGTPVEGKLLGDGVLATFPSAASAIQAAARCARAGEEIGLPLHIGVHAGDVIREHDNIFGGAVNLAARIADVAQPGDVVVSDVVRTLGRTSAGVDFEDLGEQSLKGVAEPQRLWRVVQP